MRRASLRPAKTQWRGARSGVAWLAVGLVLLGGPLRAGDLATSTEAPLPTAAQSLARLTTIEAEATRLRPQSPLQTRTGNIAILLDETEQGLTTPYSSDGVRFLVLRMFVVNLTEEARSLDLRGLRLESGGKSLDWHDRPSGIEGHPFRTGNRYLAIREISTPEDLKLPPGGVAATRVLFAGLDRDASVPAMTLVLPTAAGVLHLDVNLYARSVLQLREERTGPRDCLALLTIGGELNSVNAGALVEELETLPTRNLTRCVVRWAETAPPPADYLQQWLSQAHDPNPYNTQFRHLPSFPGALRELHLAAIPGSGVELDERVHADSAAAVSAALRTVFEGAPVDELVRSLRAGPAEVRAAALRHGAHRLTDRELPLVLQAAGEGPVYVRSAALAALAAFTDPRALDRLTEACRDRDPEIAAAAIAALAGHRFPAGPERLAPLLAEELPVPQPKLIQILAAHPRPEWQPTILTLATSSDSKVRQAALEALARLGHPRLLDILTQALHSDDDRIREVAFAVLIGLHQPEADAAALDFTLECLAREPPTGNMMVLLQRLRDQRAVPSLLRHLDRSTASRDGLIQLLAEIGDQEVAAGIAARFEQFSASEQIQALEALRKLESPLGRPLALRLLASEDASLVQAALQTLQSDATDAETAQLAQWARSLPAQRHNPKLNLITVALGAIGSPLARSTLLELKDAPEELRREAAAKGLEVLWKDSPARDLAQNAWLRLKVAEARRRKIDMDAAQLAAGAAETPGSVPPADHEARSADLQVQRRELQVTLTTAERLVHLAERLDPEHPRVLLARGIYRTLTGDDEGGLADLQAALRLQDRDAELYDEVGQFYFHRDRLQESLEPLQKAYELDGTNDQALTSRGLALVRLGRVDEGIELVRQELPKFQQGQQRAVFLYNVACVYGRAVEQLRTVRNLRADDPRLKDLEAEAVRLLQESIRYGLAEQTGDPDMLAYMRSDPDLIPLQHVPEFRRLSELDLPPDQRTRPQRREGLQ